MAQALLQTIAGHEIIIPVILQLISAATVENRKFAHLDVEVESNRALCARAKRSSNEVPETSSRKRLSKGQGPVLPECCTMVPQPVVMF